LAQLLHILIIAELLYVFHSHVISFIWFHPVLMDASLTHTRMFLHTWFLCPVFKTQATYNLVILMVVSSSPVISMWHLQM